MTAPAPTGSSQHPQPPRELARQRGTVLAGMMGMAFGISTLGFTYSIGPFINPLIAEFGWTRQQIFGAQPLVTLMVVTMSAVVGAVADRANLRLIITGSQLLFGAMFFALALTLDSLTRLYWLYALLGVAGGGTVGVGFAQIISRRFERQRGLALGITMAGTGVCGFLVPPYATWAIGEFGWRGAYVALGLLPILVAAPLSWRFLGEKRSAPQAELRPAPAAGAPSAGAHSTSEPAPGLPGAHLGEALRDYRFWCMTIGLFFCSGLLTAMVTNLVPLLQERGNSASTAAMIAAVFGAAVIVGRIGVGTLLDRYWAPGVGAALMFPAALATLALALLDPGVGACLLIVFIAGLAGGAEVDLMAFLTARYFGLREFGRIFAGVYIAFALGPGVLVVVFGRLRDISGSYQGGLLAAAAAIALFGVLLLCLGPYPAATAANNED